MSKSKKYKNKKLNFNSCGKEQRFLSSKGCLHLINDVCTIDETICVCKKKSVDISSVLKQSRRLLLKASKVIKSKKIYDRNKFKKGE